MMLNQANSESGVVAPTGIRSKQFVTGKELRELRAKANALDEAVGWLTGRMDSEKLMTVYDILTKRKPLCKTR